MPLGYHPGPAGGAIPVHRNAEFSHLKQGLTGFGSETERDALGSRLRTGGWRQGGIDGYELSTGGTWTAKTGLRFGVGNAAMWPSFAASFIDNWP